MLMRHGGIKGNGPDQYPQPIRTRAQCNNTDVQPTVCERENRGEKRQAGDKGWVESYERSTTNSTSTCLDCRVHCSISKALAPGRQIVGASSCSRAHRTPLAEAHSPIVQQDRTFRDGHAAAKSRIVGWCTAVLINMTI